VVAVEERAEDERFVAQQGVRQVELDLLAVAVDEVGVEIEAVGAPGLVAARELTPDERSGSDSRSPIRCRSGKCG
jgi:hypothetical protein